MNSGPDDPQRRPPRAAPRRIDPRATPGGPVPPRQVPSGRTPPPRQVPSGRTPPRRLPPPPPSPRGRPGQGPPDPARHGRHEREPLAGPGTPPTALAEDDVERLDESSSTGLARDTDSSIVKTSGSIALATLTSRITGFVRTVLILALLGPTLASAFNAADVLPNMIAEVVLGAVLTAIVIPLLARAEAEDEDGGRSFINKIFTLTVTVLGAATVIAVIAAPVLTSLNVDNDEIRPLATALAYFLLLEILFYGLTALFIAILNLKGFFKPGAWAPVLNNVVQISTLAAFWAMGPFTLNPISMTDPQLLVLGIGCSLGVVLQAMILVPWIRRAGVKLRLEWGLDDRLKKFGNMAVAIVTYVAILQVGLIITYRIASAATTEGISVYYTHWQLLQLPYGVLGVTILTAIMPRLSRNAAVNDDKAVVDDMSLATRLTMVALVPVVSFMTFFGPAIGIAVFNFGRFDAEVAAQLGSVLAWGAFTLIPYSMTLVQLRVFYARADAWTPTFMVLGITAVKITSSYLGPVLFDDPNMVIRWLAFSNGLGYLVGAIVGHYLLRRRLGNARLTDVARTTILTVVISVAVAATVWAVANLSGLHRLSTNYGKIGSLVYLLIMAVVVLGVIYAGLAAAKIPDVVAIFAAVQRVVGRFIPALAPASPPPGEESHPTITVQFPRVSDDESLPYSGQVQVVRRFDRGTASWQSYAVHTGGATNQRQSYVGGPPVPRSTTRYRRRGFAQVSDTDIDATQAPSEPEPTAVIPAVGEVSEPADSPAADSTPLAGDASESVVAEGYSTPVPPTRRARGPRLVPGAAIAGGRYRLLDHHGGTRGLQFWRARDINLDREVGLTFVDADQLAAPPERGETVKPSDSGPQAVLSRTMRLGQITSPGVARVLDVVRGSSGGIVVSEWVPGSSLADVAGSEPSAIGAARAVRALAAAAELAHRSGGALSIDHPDRIRISEDGNAVLAFPGTLAGDDKASDVRGLGAVLYALLLARWPLDAATGSEIITTDDTSDPIGGLQVAEPGKAGAPIEPRDARDSIPFEISAVASRALDGNRGIRTAATVQHVLDQATVLDLQTDMLPVIESDTPPVAMSPARRATADPATQAKERTRNIALLVGAALFTLFLVLALVAWMTNIFGGGSDSTDIDSILTTSEPAGAAGAAGQNGAQEPAAIPLQAVTLVDFSSQPPDDATNLANVVSGAAPPWKTDLYRGSADFGGLKDGLGLMFNLGGEKAVRTVTITTPTPGFTVSVRTSDTATPTSLNQTQQVATGTVTQPTTTLTITNPQPAGYLMVWITSLVQTPSGYQAQIGQVQLAG